MKENAQNDIIGRLQDKVNGMLTEAMASAALATASMTNNQTSDEAILRVELRKLHAEFLQNSQAQCLKITEKVTFNIASEASLFTFFKVDKSSLKMSKMINFD